jgi:hypothetical protein
LVAHGAEITWPGLLGSSADQIDDDARLRLIRDLGLVRAAWVLPILTQAYKEEREQPHRDAVRQALAGCEHPDVDATLDLAAQPLDA